MTLTRKDFVRLTVVTLGSTALGLSCGAPSGPDAGSGGGGASTGGGGATGGGGSTGGGTGGGSTGGGGGSTGGGTGGGSTGGGGGSTGGGGGSTGGGGGSTGGGSAASCLNNGGTASDITFNHGHVLMVPAADFTAAGAKTYDITGSALHGHSITLSQAQRASVLAGTPVTVTSTLTGHTHDVTVACA